ncbi:hypothetical protein [Paraburkholderia flagellata]|uniref:hypothetical protein n=1 Tax=Paraburkholderia flagellata TaxID=2883241 RepID=UPI001F35229C|nr:hypothetical protein [Paraburkholderia flagellata]
MNKTDENLQLHWKVTFSSAPAREGVAFAANHDLTQPIDAGLGQICPVDNADDNYVTVENQPSPVHQPIPVHP